MIFTICRHFQDGVELHQNNSWTCTKFDLKKCASKLQPGYDTKVYIGFETSDITKDVSVECKSLISGDDTSNDVKSLLSVNSVITKSQHRQQHRQLLRLRHKLLSRRL